ncbi:golgin candidate 3-like isoform X2 [Macadamia integrifolia]|nr:golgin candidate 3-like isoform X2 [Macadamia integrifolia]
MSGRSSPDKKIVDDPDSLDKPSNNLDQVCSSRHFRGKEEMELSLQKYEKDLMEVRLERNNAVQELTRLKLHLLEKEVEELEKMDEDSRIIEELQANSEYQRAQISHFGNTLKQAIASQEEVKKTHNNELQKAKETISDLKQKLASCMSTVDAKNSELLNLQTALGQYHAESEAKEHLERYLALAREESSKLSESLKDANQHVEVSRQEKEEILGKLSQAERMISEGKHRVQKAEEDNTKLRRALEQSMSRLNRMSMDSNYFVDRRIVIKLLVAYFQGNHSKEVLDVMVRMLEVSEEDKRKIGVARHGAGKGVVQGVLGLPGRLVGGIFGGRSPELHNHVPSENQSFADMWVDFLLKETEERERREAVEATGVSKDNPQGRSTSSNGPTGSVPNYRTSTSSTASGFS